MELLNNNNILSDNKEEIIISDIHGDFAAILNILNNHLNTTLKFKLDNNLIFNDCIIKLNINNNIYYSINSSIIKHYDIIMNENINFKFLKNDNLRKLKNKRLILLGDVYDPYNFRSLRIKIESLIKENKFNKDNKLLLDDDGKIMINNNNIYKFGNILFLSNNKLVLCNMMMTYKLLLCLEKYLDVKYIIGNHEISSFDEYPICIKNKILNNFKTYYYNSKKNILYCHFHIESKIEFKHNHYTYNLKNIDNIFYNECKDYINNVNNNNFKKLNSIIIHCLDNKKTSITKYSNKTYKFGNPHYFIMYSQSIFQQFINKMNPIIICGHYNFKDACTNTKINDEWDLNVYHNFNNNRLIYYIDCDLSIFHSNNFINKSNDKKGIVLNCQYIFINNNNDDNNDNNINYIKILNDYLYYINNENETINNENYNEKDYNKLLIFNTFDNKNIINNISFYSLNNINSQKIIDF